MSRIQRSPIDFRGHAVLGLEVGFFFDSAWKSIRAAVEAYSVLGDDDVSKRRARLRELATLSQRWLQEQGHTDSSVHPDPTSEEGKRLDAIQRLRSLIVDEHTTRGGPDVAASEGLLDVEGAHVAAANPLLTRPRAVNDDRVRGFVTADSDLFDEQLRKVGHISRGAVVRVHPQRQGGAIGDGLKKTKVWIRPAPADDRIYGDCPQFDPGFVTEAALSFVDLERDDSANLMYEQRADRGLFPLFQGLPRVDDVEQASLGDCFLLAGVMTVVRRDPTFFVHAMKDHGDGVVSVRLFDISGVEPRTFTPRIIHVEKSVVVERGESRLVDGYNRGATWVHLLEKAYVAAGYGGQQRATLPTSRTAWSQIQSGRADVALEHLTGKAAKQTDIQAGAFAYGNHKTWLPHPGQTWATNDPRFEARLPGDADLRALWASKSTRFEQQLIELHDVHDEVRKQDVVDLVADTFSNASLRDAITSYIDDMKLYPGPRGSGQDTDDQFAIFETIAAAVRANKHVVVQSKESMKRTGGSKSGQSAGEHKSKGLAGPHGYEVITVSPLDDDRRDGVLRWVKLRNPWGTYGREYTDRGTVVPDGSTAIPQDRLRARQSDAGEFWIPLSDLTKRFNKLVIQEQ